MQNKVEYSIFWLTARNAILQIYLPDIPFCYLIPIYEFC